MAFAFTDAVGAGGPWSLELYGTFENQTGVGGFEVRWQSGVMAGEDDWPPALAPQKTAIEKLAETVLLEDFEADSGLRRGLEVLVSSLAVAVEAVVGNAIPRAWGYSVDVTPTRVVFNFELIVPPARVPALVANTVQSKICAGEAWDLRLLDDAAGLVAVGEVGRSAAVFADVPELRAIGDGVAALAQTGNYTAGDFVADVGLHAWVVTLVTMLEATCARADTRPARAWRASVCTKYRHASDVTDTVFTFYE